MTKYAIVDTQILIPYFSCVLLPDDFSFSDEFTSFLEAKQFETWIIHYSIYFELGNLMKKFLGADISKDCLDYIDSSKNFEVTSFDQTENELAKIIMVTHQYSEPNDNNEFHGIGIADASLLAYLKLKTLRPSRNSYKLLTYDRDLKDATRAEGLNNNLISYIPQPY
jgi:hypothetical protein